LQRELKPYHLSCGSGKVNASTYLGGTEESYKHLNRTGTIQLKNNHWVKYQKLPVACAVGA
jgi:hypothetical protein